MKTFFSFLLLTTSFKASALTQLEKQEKMDACEQAYKTFIAASGMTDQVGRYATVCRQECDQSRWGFGDARSMTYYGKCSNPTTASGASPKCLNAESKLNTTQETEIWNVCVNDCSQAVSEASTPAEKNKYSLIGQKCQAKIEQAPVDPVDPNGDAEQDDNTVAEDDSASDDLEPADSGLPNQNALNSAYQGLGMGNNNNRTPIDGGRGADFSGGGGSRGYDGIAGSGGGGSGFGDPSIFPPVRIDDTPGQGQGKDVVQGSYAQPGGGAPGGGSSGMGGPAGGPARGGGAGAAGGGARSSIAGSQLNKVGQNSFWAADGGGGSSGSSSGSRKTAATALKPKEKKTKFGPSYISKDDNSLLKLFGGPLKVNQTTGSQSCSDNTVFCTHENFFERVERYPSSEIKQTPQ